MGSLGVLSPHITTRRGYLCVVVAEVECIAVRELCTGVVQPDRLQGARFVVADWCLLQRTTPGWSPLGLVLHIEHVHWCVAKVSGCIVGPAAVAVLLGAQTGVLFGLLTYPPCPGLLTPAGQG